MRHWATKLISIALIMGSATGCSQLKHLIEVPEPSATFMPQLHGKLIIAKDSPAGEPQLCILPLGSGSKSIQTLLSTSKEIEDASFSPDGKLIAFARAVGAYRAIYVANADGSNIKTVSKYHVKARVAGWSPNSAKLAYACWDPGLPDGAINVIDLNRGTDKIVGSGETNRSYPVWSPDGSTIAFHVYKNDNTWDIGVMDADGSNFRCLTKDCGMNWLPNYSPDGSQLAFWSNRTGRWELHTMHSDGSNQHAVTNYGPLGMLAKDVPRAVWSPDGLLLAFIVSPDDDPRAQSIRVVDMQGKQAKIEDGVVDLIDWRPESYEIAPLKDHKNLAAISLGDRRNCPGTNIETIGLIERIKVHPPTADHPAVSQRTIDTVRECVHNLPPVLYKLLSDGNATINIAPNIEDRWPGSGDQFKPNEPDTTLGEEAGRTYGRDVNIYERSKARGKNTLLEPYDKTEIARTAYHELGHACDCIAGPKPDVAFSDTKEFKQALNTDLNNICKDAKEQSNYFTQPHEACAESLAYLAGSQAAQPLVSDYPNVLRLLRKKFNLR